MNLNEERMKRYRKEQSRSRFAMVRSKVPKEGKLLPWCAEVRKPKEIEEAKIMINSLDTDVEAAVAASVVVGVYEKSMKNMGIDDANRKWGSKPPLQCQNYLINESSHSFPDPSNNLSVRDFAKLCVEDYKKILKAVEEKTQPMPDDKGMADAITLYRGAIRYDQKHKEG